MEGPDNPEHAWPPQFWREAGLPAIAQSPFSLGTSNRIALWVCSRWRVYPPIDAPSVRTCRQASRMAVQDRAASCSVVAPQITEIRITHRPCH
jgi:hypothetical protein